MEKEDIRKKIAERIDASSIELWNIASHIGMEFSRADLMCMHAREIINSITYILDECSEMVNPTEE